MVVNSTALIALVTLIGATVPSFAEAVRALGV